MSGVRRNGTRGTMEQQIEKAQVRVVKTKAAYDSAVDTLQKLLDKRNAQRKDGIWKAIIKSSKSYDEILHFISDNAGEDEG